MINLPILAYISMAALMGIWYCPVENYDSLHVSRFSRKIMWLHVEPSRMNANVVLGYYLKVAGCLNGIMISTYPL